MKKTHRLFSFSKFHYSFLPPFFLLSDFPIMNRFTKFIFVLFFAASLPVLAAEISLTHGDGGDCQTFAQAQKLWRDAQKNARPGETVTVLIGPGDWYFDETLEIGPEDRRVPLVFRAADPKDPPRDRKTHV